MLSLVGIGNVMPTTEIGDDGRVGKLPYTPPSPDSRS